MIEIVIDSPKLVAIQDELKRGIGDLTPAHQAVGEYMTGKIDQEFRDEVDPYGNPWLKNSPATVNYKRSRGLINKVLQATGHMRRSVGYRATADGLSVGLSDPKALKHQRGKGVPVRLILGVSKGDLTEIIEIYRLFLPDEGVR